MLDTSNLGGFEQFGFTDGISQPTIDWERRRRCAAIRPAMATSRALASSCSAIQTSTISTRNGPLIRQRAARTSCFARRGRSVEARPRLERDVFRAPRPAPGRPRILVVCQVRNARRGDRRQEAKRRSARAGRARADRRNRDQLARPRAEKLYLRGRSARPALSVRRAHPPRKPTQRRLCRAAPTRSNRHDRRCWAFATRGLARRPDVVGALSPDLTARPRVRARAHARPRRTRAGIAAIRRAGCASSASTRTSRASSSSCRTRGSKRHVRRLIGESDPLLGRSRAEARTAIPTDAFVTAPRRRCARRASHGCRVSSRSTGGAYFFLPSLRALALSRAGASTPEGTP